MSFPNYPRYARTGNHWLSEVPEHWTLARFSRVIAKIKDGTHGTFARTPEGKPLLSAKNVVAGRIEIAEDESLISNEDHAEIVANGFPASGDLLLTIVGSIGRAAVYTHEEPLAFQRSVCFVRLASGHDPQFYYYFTQSKFFQEQLQSRSKSAAQSGVYMGDVVAIPVVYPEQPLEQCVIAAFLDSETAKIDALVEEQKRLIELLKEKRQAVILQAVTKGLDPNVPMKDSGVEWLGKVPAHWDVKAIKWLSPVLRGASPRPIDDPKYFDDDGEYAWVRIADASASDGVLHETTQRLSALGSSLSVKLLPGSLFVSIAGTVGKPCIAGIKCCIHDGFVYFPRLRIDPMYLFRLFESGACYAGLGKMGTQLNLNTDTIGSIRVGLPPPDELSAILAFIDSETRRLDQLTAEANCAMLLLTERRSALISAAVTGKIDVRGLAPQTDGAAA